MAPQKKQNSRFFRTLLWSTVIFFHLAGAWIEHLFLIIITPRSSNLVENFLFYSWVLYTPLFSRTVIFAVLARCGNSRVVNFAILLMLSLLLIDINWSGNFREGLTREIRENKTTAKISARTVISYGLSFSGFARFPEFRGTINAASAVHKLSEYCVQWSMYCVTRNTIEFSDKDLQSRHVIGTEISL